MYKDLSDSKVLIVLIQFSAVSNSASWKIEKRRDKEGSFVAILTDLSKAFDCLLHDLLIANLEDYQLILYEFLVSL